MPKKLDRCVTKVQKKIDAGKLPPESNPWAICKAAIKDNPHSKGSKSKKIVPIVIIGTGIIFGYYLLRRN